MRCIMNMLQSGERGGGRRWDGSLSLCCTTIRNFVCGLQSPGRDPGARNYRKSREWTAPAKWAKFINSTLPSRRAWPTNCDAAMRCVASGVGGAISRNEYLRSAEFSINYIHSSFDDLIRSQTRVESIKPKHSRARDHDSERARRGAVPRLLGSVIEAMCCLCVQLVDIDSDFIG